MSLTSLLRSIVTASGLLVLALVGTASGQELEPQVAAAPLPIPISEVAERADALSRQLRHTRERLAPAGEIDAIAAEISARTTTLAERKVDTTSLLSGQPTLARLGELERQWAREGDDLATWRRTLTRRAAALEDEVEFLKKAETTWSATLESAPSGDAPPEVLEAMRLSISEIKDVRGATSQRRGEVLTLQNRVSQQELVVSETLDGVRAARAGIRSRLFVPDEPPIWAAMIQGEKLSAGQIAAAFATSRDTIRAFLVERSARFVALALLFPLALLGALGLKRSIAVRQAEGGEIEGSSRVFRRPISLAWLLTLLGVFWLFPLAPNAVLELAGLLLLVPMLRLLPSLIHPGGRPILHGVAAFYVVDRLRRLLEGAPLEARTVFLLECLAGALFCLALLRPARLAATPDRERFPRLPGMAVRVSLAVFTASALANVLGYVSLATLLGDGLLTSIYSAIGLYAAVRVVGVILNVTTKTAWAQQIHFLRARRAVAVDWIRWGISIGALALWVYWTLGAFAIGGPVIGTIREILAAPLRLGTVSISLGDLVAFGLTVAAAVVISRVVRFVLMEDLFPRIRTGRGIPYAVSSTAHYVILFSGFMLALAAAGIDLSKFTVLAGAFGVGIGFGLQNVVNNFVSGIVLLFERPIQVGDTIDMGDLVGVVKRIGIRSSTVRTYTGSEVIVPNGDLISQRVINWTLSDKTRRVDVAIGVKYGTDPEQVLQILSSLAESHERVLKYPPPVALFRSHGESSLDFELRAWIAHFDDWFLIESELNTAINRALTEAGMEIPFPQRDLHLRSVDESAARYLVAKENGT